MGDVTTELVLGAQSRAAASAAGSIPDLQQALTTGAEGIQTGSTGFSGSAAGAFYLALKAWFDVGAQIPTGVQRYALLLGVTDQNVLQSQQAATRAYQNAATRLGGPAR